MRQGRRGSIVDNNRVDDGSDDGRLSGRFVKQRGLGEGRSGGKGRRREGAVGDLTLDVLWEVELWPLDGLDGRGKCHQGHEQ